MKMNEIETKMEELREICRKKKVKVELQAFFKIDKNNCLNYLWRF